jgi:hypothetical protein
LFPDFQFVAGELGLFLVPAKIELHVNVGHGFSLWRPWPGVKTGLSTRVSHYFQSV